MRWKGFRPRFRPHRPRAAEPGFHARAAAWDLTALLNAANPKAALPERHIWLIRLLEWARRPSRNARKEVAGVDDSTWAATPLPILRIRHLLNVLDRNELHRENVVGVLARFWREIDAASLLADVGLAQRSALFGEIAQRLRSRLLPESPATANLAELFNLLFPDDSDADWIEAVDEATLARISGLFSVSWQVRADDAPDRPSPDWRQPFLNAVLFVTGGVSALGFSSRLRQRMTPGLLDEKPFRRLQASAERFIACTEHGAGDEALRELQYLRALLDKCRKAAESVGEHLEEHGVSVDVVFDVDQLRLRTQRIDDLLTCVVSPAPQSAVTQLLAQLVRGSAERRSVQALFARHYSMLARKVSERSAENGALYITRDRAGYMKMFRAAFGGGAVLAGTTLLKFFLGAIAFSAFWAGFLAGVNYAASFVLIYLLHFTVATKQPAMTAPAMAEKLSDVKSDEAVEGFVDEVAHLLRSQSAGIFGNLFAVAPVVLAAQWGAKALFGEPLVGHEASLHVLETLTLLGPTPFYAALTGVLLFASSLIAGWVENWFVWHRLDTAIQYNPAIVARLGASRAMRWGTYWRANISGIAANVSLGLMLGLVPAVASFFALPIEVRHVTLSTGQLAAALGSEGFGILHQAPFWWCLAGIALTGVLNLAISFFLAFKVALRSRGIRLQDRSRIYAAIRRRLWHRPASFLIPPRT